jgi:hypothetical protein
MAKGIENKVKRQPEENEFENADIKLASNVPEGKASVI